MKEREVRGNIDPVSERSPIRISAGRLVTVLFFSVILCQTSFLSSKLYTMSCKPTRDFIVNIHLPQHGVVSHKRLFLWC